MTATDGLRITDLRRRFGAVQALDGLSMHVRPGTLHGFVGANGAGKTTAMRIVVGVDRADGGTVELDGHALTAADRGRFGYLPEERGLYPDMRVADQVRFLGRLHGMSAHAATAETERLLGRLGLTDRAGDATTALSLGNQQRVQLAAALVHRPSLLILDEPFSGLDPVAADVMAELLAEEVERGVPVLFSSHQLELVERLCHDITIINAGRPVATGPIDDLRRRRRDRQLLIELDGPHPDWGSQPGVLAVAGDGQRVTLTLVEDTDEQPLLDLARGAGRVTRFAPVEPTLAELYREVAS